MGAFSRNRGIILRPVCSVLQSRVSLLISSDFSGHITCIISVYFLSLCPNSPALTFLMFLDHTQWHPIVGRTSLDEWSARHRDLYLPTHNTHKRRTDRNPYPFEPAIPTSEWPQIFALDRSAFCYVSACLSCPGVYLRHSRPGCCGPHFLFLPAWKYSVVSPLAFQRAAHPSVSCVRCRTCSAVMVPLPRRSIISLVHLVPCLTSRHRASRFVLRIVLSILHVTTRMWLFQTDVAASPKRSYRLHSCTV